MIGLDVQILGPAFIAGLMILATHVPLGLIVIERNIVFIGIALAQVAATGVVFGNLMWGGTAGWTVQASAAGAALMCAALLVWTDKRYPHIQEVIVGVVYVTAAAALLLMLSYVPSGAEFLKRLLIGQILWVSPFQLFVVGLVYAVALAIWYFRDLSREIVLFYVVFAVVITLSVQIVGVLLVFASLIVPALAARAARPRWRHLVGFNIGAAGYLLGLAISTVFNLPTGAVIVCALVPTALIVGALVNHSAIRAARVAGEAGDRGAKPHWLRPWLAK